MTNIIYVIINMVAIIFFCISALYTGYRIIINRNCYDKNTKREMFEGILMEVLFLALIGWLRSM